MMKKSRIVGIGTYVPENILTNFDLEKIVDTSDEWIRERTGISERHIIEKNSTENNSDIGKNAALSAMKSANISAEEIDCIICGTFTPDSAFPSTACIIQDKIGAKNATAFDISAACSGFIYSLLVADSFIQSGKYKTVLVVGSEIISRVLDWTDRNTCVLFGDGAGAVILKASEKPDHGILSIYTKSDGSLGNMLSLSAWGSPRYLKMNGGEVFKYAVRMMGEAVTKVLESAKISVDDINWLVTHQANTRIIKATANLFNMPMEKVIINVDKFGNTSSASIPLALKDGLDNKNIKEGDIVVIAAFGGGLTWGAAAIRW